MLILGRRESSPLKDQKGKRINPGRWSKTEVDSIHFPIIFAQAAEFHSSHLSHQDEQLRTLAEKYKGKNWKKVAQHFPDRSDIQCQHRWQKVVDPELVKGPWTKEVRDTD